MLVRARRSLPADVCVQVDGQLDSGSCSPVDGGVSFAIREDPVIAGTQPDQAPANGTFSFVVSGTNVDAVQSAQLRLFTLSSAVAAPTLAMSTCAAVNATALACPLPVIAEVVAAVPQLGSTGLDTMFELEADGAHYNGTALTYRRNPVLIGLQPEAAGPGDIVVISGLHLTTFSPHVVYVAGVAAAVQVESDNQITIEVPDADILTDVPLDVTYEVVGFGFNVSLSGAFQVASQSQGPDVTPIAGGVAAAAVNWAS